jgi:hypothetical protein
MRRLGIAVILLSSVAGCSTSSSLVDAVAVTASPPNGSADFGPPVIIVETGPPAKDWRNEVSGTACQRYAWDSVPTNDAAVAALLQKTAERGFNTVHSVKVGSDVRSLAMNCWAAITATGIAFNDSGRPAIAAARPTVKPSGDDHRLKMGQGG